ncbi:MAG: hypothetical protein K9N01_12355, partial [Cephaloticoccus sp.]|nr:hypothetical protein [Cephaloticoccus sp.]
ITYQSPAWRSQSAVAAEPNDYADTVVLRNRRAKSRYIVVFEVSKGANQIQEVSVNKAVGHADIRVAIKLTDARQLDVSIPGTLAANIPSRFAIRQDKSKL